jgi:putative ABC transport system permease protein
VEFALTLSLLASAGLLARTLLAVYRADSIVDTSHVMLAGVNLPPQKYGMPAELIAFYSALESRVGALGSVEAAALASNAPFYNAATWSLTRPVDKLTRTSDVPGVSYVLIGPRYFDTLRLHLIRGRVFTDLDGTPGHNTVIVNQLLASRFFPRVDPIGQQIRLTDPANPDQHAPWLTVVGVSPTIRQHYAQQIDPVAYVPYRQNPISGMLLITRSRSDGALLTPILREQIRELDPDLPLTDIMALEWLVSGTRFANRVSATLFGISATLALLLATVGLHTILAFAIRRRTREIGIRIALGAQPWQIVWLFVSRVVGPLVCGFTFGLAGALVVGRIIGGMLIQTSPHDPLTLIAISIVLIATAGAAIVLPARRITRLEPASALRHS